MWEKAKFETADNRFVLNAKGREKKDYEIFIKVDRRKETVKTPTYINQIRSKKRGIKWQET